ncbi:MAG: hypothetical protein ACP5M0_07370 [Desulfomonilaceae bacterium]
MHTTNNGFFVQGGPKSTLAAGWKERGYHVVIQGDIIFSLAAHHGPVAKLDHGRREVAAARFYEILASVEQASVREAGLP